MRIKIVNLNKVYPGGKKALKDLNLEIEPGMFGLLGPNGAGKTSLMRIMTLLQSCTSGTIYFDDYDIAKDRKAIRSLLGYLPQDFRFFEKLKTWEFLDYGAGLAGIKGKQHRAEVVDEMLRKVGLFEVRDRWANRLSGGMKRRLGIAQAIIGNPKVIIVDEPTTGLDPEDISSTCKKLALLNRGELKFEGSPDEMIDLARGKVWEIFVTDMEYEEIKDKYPIISTIPADGGMEIQVVADAIDGYSHKAIEPNLEHAYVYYMDYLLKDKMNMQVEAIKENELFK